MSARSLVLVDLAAQDRSFGDLAIAQVLADDAGGWCALSGMRWPMP